MARYVSLMAGAALVLNAAATAALAHPDVHGRPHFKGPPMNPTAVMRAFEGDGQPSQSLQFTANAPCNNGFADIFPCHNVDLLALVPLAELNAGSANDIWGWSRGGREFALIGLNNGTAFVEITTPTSPVYIGKLPTHTSNSSWRDIKVFEDHAFIVSEAGSHGMQVFDLTRLLDANPNPDPITFDEDALYNGFGNAHNIVIDEQSGFAYAVGTNTCSGGLHIIDIRVPWVPSSPKGVGIPTCYSGDGYTHDAQCVSYIGPDGDHQNKEICLAANEDTVTIVDVTDKFQPIRLSRTGYNQDGYTHQAWLDEGHEYLFLDDETDELSFGHDTLTRVLDVSDLDQDGPRVVDSYINVGTPAIDHNLYVQGDMLFQANYRSGLRVLEIVRDTDGFYLMLEELGFFDIYPSSDSASFNGAWSTYPYFPSGNIVVSGIEQGLFVLALNIQDEVIFVAPGDGDVVSGIVDIDIYVRDADLGALAPEVDWQVDNDGTTRTTTAAGDNLYIASWNSTNATEGSHRLTATMTDSALDETTSTIDIVVNNDAPNAIFTSPDPADGPVSGNVTLVATADSDGTVVSVTFYDGVVEIGTDTSEGDGWSVNWNTKKVTKENHDLTVKATDSLGQTSKYGDSMTLTVASNKGGGKPGGGGDGGGGGGGPNCDKKPDHPKCP